MRIRWTDDAIRDFTNICDYIDQRTGAPTARRVARAIHHSIHIFGKLP